MPRKARIDAPGALHHIIIRGIERKAIFKNNTDRNNFVERLGQIISETDTGCYAWVLMTNPYAAKNRIGSHRHSHAAVADRICFKIVWPVCKTSPPGL